MKKSRSEIKCQIDEMLELISDEDLIEVFWFLKADLVD